MRQVIINVHCRWLFTTLPPTEVLRLKQRSKANTVFTPSFNLCWMFRNCHNLLVSVHTNMFKQFIWTRLAKIYNRTKKRVKRGLLEVFFCGNLRIHSASKNCRKLCSTTGSTFKDKVRIFHPTYSHVWYKHQQGQYNQPDHQYDVWLQHPSLGVQEGS